MNKKYGFTLSEALITIGIIGIVAAMTLPLLTKKYQTFILQQQFRKVYSVLQIAIDKVQFDMGENVGCYYGSTVGTEGSNWSDCLLFFQNLSKQMNVIKTCKGKALEDGCLPPESYSPQEDLYATRYSPDDIEHGKDIYIKDCRGFSSKYIETKNTVYILNNEFILITYMTGGAALFVVDINGKKKPNKWGYDLFSFRLYKEKKNNSYIKLVPNNGCISIEKGGVSTESFINRMHRGKANF